MNKKIVYLEVNEDMDIVGVSSTGEGNSDIGYKLIFQRDKDAVIEGVFEKKGETLRNVTKGYIGKVIQRPPTFAGVDPAVGVKEGDIKTILPIDVSFWSI